MIAVLLVDSSAAFLGVMEMLVRRLGYGVRTARDATGCLGELSALPADLVMTEVRLPDRCGTDLCREIRENPATARTQVVMVTTDNSAETRRRALTSGCAAYITKPVTVRSVFEVLEGFRPGRRRRHLRANMRLEAAASVDGERVLMDTLNFGEGGVFLRTPRPRPVGEILRLSFALPGREVPLEVAGEVLYAFGEGVPGHPSGMGVKFLDVPPAEQEFLARFLESALAGPRGDAGEHLALPRPGERTTSLN